MSSTKWSKLQTISFVQSTLQAFFDNDLYRATQLFISQAQGSFGLVTTSTLEESELVLCAKGQPITIGYNWDRGYMVYASEPAAVDRILLNQPQSFRLDLEQRHGEVAKVSAKDITVYSIAEEQELRGTASTAQMDLNGGASPFIPNQTCRTWGTRSCGC